LGAPVDLVNEGLKLAGWGSEKPVAGSEWFGDRMQSMGMVSAERDPAAELAAGFVDPVSGIGSALKLARSLPMAVTAWHGSPFNFDKFDLTKLGTGEGAQAYGHGMYFAGSQKVADWYKSKLSKDVYTINGNSIDTVHPTILADIQLNGKESTLRSLESRIKALELDGVVEALR